MKNGASQKYFKFIENWCKKCLGTQWKTKHHKNISNASTQPGNEFFFDSHPIKHFSIFVLLSIFFFYFSSTPPSSISNAEEKFPLLFSASAAAILCYVIYCLNYVLKNSYFSQQQRQLCECVCVYLSLGKKEGNKLSTQK